MFEKVCGICQNKIRNAVRKNKGSEIIKKKMKERNKTVKLSLEIDKEFYPDLIEKLDDAAREDIRGREHEALYIIADEGSEVKAVADGVIEKIEYTEELGHQITIYHGNGYKSIYGQLQEDMNVRDGEIIKKGRIIGYVSEVSDYYMLEGNHLYFQFIEDEKAINPSELVK